MEWLKQQQDGDCAAALQIQDPTLGASSLGARALVFPRFVMISAPRQGQEFPVVTAGCPVTESSSECCAGGQ